MSSFYLREGEPYAYEYGGDYATHPIYSQVRLISKLVTDNSSSFYIARTLNEEYVIVNIEDCTEIGYWGE